jgi:lysozyme
LKVSAAGRKMIEGFEGLRLQAYQDVVGVWTIGYGHTEGVRPGQVITQEQADQMFADDLDNIYGAGVETMIGTAPTTQNQFDAMVSLAYNIGVGAFGRSSVRRKHMLDDYTGAVAAFLLYNRAGGRVLPALSRRRAVEAALYSAAAPQDTPAVSSTDRRLAKIGNVLAILQQQGVKIMATLADIQAAVAAEKTVEDSVLALLTSLEQQLKDAIAANDPAAMQAVVDDINAHKQAMADAVAANTKA